MYLPNEARAPVSMTSAAKIERLENVVRSRTVELLDRDTAVRDQDHRHSVLYVERPRNQSCLGIVQGYTSRPACPRRRRHVGVLSCTSVIIITSPCPASTPPVLPPR
jgi:hypothetical protein